MVYFKRTGDLKNHVQNLQAKTTALEHLMYKYMTLVWMWVCFHACLSSRSYTYLSCCSLELGRRGNARLHNLVDGKTELVKKLPRGWVTGGAHMWIWPQPTISPIQEIQGGLGIYPNKKTKVCN